MSYKDLTGKRSGKRVAQWPVGRKAGRIMWLCLCDCGDMSVVPGSCFVKGRQSNCRGCGHTQHGLAYSLQYKMWGAAKHRAKKQGLPFNIKPQDIKIPEVCPLLGIPIVQRKGSGTNHGSPSLDRVIPSLGYVVGNIRVISAKANVMKNDASLQEVELLVKNWKEQTT